MRLHYKVQGQEFPLIILHGLFGSLDNWRTQSKQLGRFFTVYALDLRNHGSSPHSDIIDYPAMAEDLREFFEMHEIDSAFVLGHSMGGKVAMQFATSYPERVDKLVVVDIAPRGYPLEHEEIFKALLALNLRDFHTREEVDSALEKSIPDVRVRQFLLKNLLHDNRGLKWRIHLKALHKNYDALGKPIEPQRAFKGPACFIRGANSNYIQESDFAGIRDWFPRFEILTVPNSGHWVHVDAPPEFSRIVIDFLNRPEPRSGRPI
jgi:esterase